MDSILFEEFKEYGATKDLCKCMADVGNGICNFSVTSIDNEKIKKKKQNDNKNYKAKTQIPKIINNIVNNTINQIHKEREWQHEKEFMTNANQKIKLVYWELNDDWCKIQIDNDITKVNKKYFKALWQTRKFT